MFFPSSHSPDRVVQEVSRNWCWIVETAGSITRGTRKQKVAALKGIICQLVDNKVGITIDKVDWTNKIPAFVLTVCLDFT